MKTSLKKTISLAIILSLLLSFLNITPVKAASSQYDTCYPISGSIPVYSRCFVRQGEIDYGSKIGTIYYSDEVKIIHYYGSALYVRYPIPGGRTKEGYIESSRVIKPGTPSTRSNYSGSYIAVAKANYKINTYRHPCSSWCGSIYVNDTVYVYGPSAKGATQVRYPTSSGWKYAWVNNDQLWKLTCIRGHIG